MPTITKPTFKLSVLAAALSPALILLAPSISYGADTIADALKDGDTKFSFRLRHEDVDVDTHGQDSNAITLKSRATYTSGDFHGFGLTLEFDDVTSFTDDDEYNDTVNGTAKTPIIDPEGTEVNQVYLSYKIADTTVKYGRQRILLDNQRFVGGVGFRQNEQTYDGLSITNNSIENLTVFAAHITNVNRIFGESSANGDHHHDTNLLNVGYKTPIGKLVGYYYDIDNETSEAASSETFGIRFSGKTELDSLTLHYEAELAEQDEGNSDGTEYDADYAHIMGGITVAGITAKVGYESLGSDDGIKAFTTPLATLHKFQGWTDQFAAVNPNEGTDDIYVSISTKIAGIKLAAVYHDLTANEDGNGNGIEDGDEYGTEIGFVAATKFDNNVGLSLKYADFSEGDDSTGKTDVNKLWLTTTYSF